MTREWRWSIQSREGAEEKKGKKKERKKGRGGEYKPCYNLGRGNGNNYIYGLDQPILSAITQYSFLMFNRPFIQAKSLVVIIR